MHAVFDIRKNKLYADKYGHVKLYASKAAAKRKARALNNRTTPPLPRMGVIEVTPKIDMHWGKPDFERV